MWKHTACEGHNIKADRLKGFGERVQGSLDCRIVQEEIPYLLRRWGWVCLALNDSCVAMLFMNVLHVRTYFYYKLLIIMLSQ
jgi:hypothetical protein